MSLRLPSPRLSLVLAVAALGTAWGAAFADWQGYEQAATSVAFLHAAGRIWLDRKRDRRLAAMEVFRRFQPPILADRLASKPDFLLRPIRQKAAVLFIDLSGFTGLSERLGPEMTRDVLWEFHTLIENEVTRHEGVVLSYMGDGAMIVFGLPEPRAADPARALETAVTLGERVGDWLKGLSARVEHGVGVRIGAHYGPVVLSRLGAEMHQHIAATGDTVNVASRLLEVAAAQHALVALSADLFDAAAEQSRLATRIAFAKLADVPIRGRHQCLAVRLWRGIGSAGQ